MPARCRKRPRDHAAGEDIGRSLLKNTPARTGSDLCACDCHFEHGPDYEVKRAPVVAGSNASKRRYGSALRWVRKM